MFAGDYKVTNDRLYLSKLGILGSVTLFLLLSVMMQWPLLQENPGLTSFSGYVLWFGPVFFSVVLSVIFYVIAIAKSSKGVLNYSFGVIYHWVLISLLPAAAISSLAYHFNLDVMQKSVLHSTGLLLAVVIYGLLLAHRRSIVPHSRVLMASVGFYALTAGLQVALLAL